jgi:FkbM family methyltransferase
VTTAQKIALARFASGTVRLTRRILRFGPEVIAVRHGLRWQLDLREGIDFSIWLLGSFEPGTVRCYERIVRKGQIVLDIGANIGAHTLPLARLVGSAGRVVAFEPTRFAYEKLCRNIKLNREVANQIHSIQAMLVGQSGDPAESRIYSSWPLVAAEDLHTGHRGRRMDTTGCRAITLDEIVADLMLQQVDFIKLDVDGHELEVLRGGRQTFTRFRPVVLLELAPYVFNDCPDEFDSMLRLLWSWGYTLHRIRRSEVLPNDVSAIRALIPEGAGINAVARCNATREVRNTVTIERRPQ